MPARSPLTPIFDPGIRRGRIVVGHQIGDPIFLPAAGMVLWCDSADAATITDNGGSPTRVQTILDKTVNANDLGVSQVGTAPKTGTATQNGLNILDFDDKRLTNQAGVTQQVTASRALTLFLAMSDKSTATEEAYFSMPAGGIEDHQTFIFERNVGELLVVQGDGALYASDADLRIQSWTIAPSGSTVQLFTVRASTTGVTLRINGVDQGVGTNPVGTMPFASFLATTPTCNFFWGARSHQSGTHDMNNLAGEVLLYDSVLTGSALSNTEGYLMAKWV